MPHKKVGLVNMPVVHPKAEHCRIPLGDNNLFHHGAPEDASADSLHADSLHEECGVFGIFGRQDAAALTALGLHALQHRGQEAAGIVSYNGSYFPSERRPGLVSDHFNRKSVIERLAGNSAVGHVRYSTTGATILRNIQPLYADLHERGFAICHNGNLTNAVNIREQIIKDGAICQSTSDTEVMLHLVARSSKRDFVEKFIDALRQIEGAYAFVGLTNDMMIGARDPLGIRPLILGDLDGAPVLCSETCALDIIGAKFVREIENGEVVVITDAGISKHRPFPGQKPRPCIFEYIYFSRPDSIVNGRSIYEYRKQMGIELARESAVDADVVVPIPDSGVPAAIGFARETGVPFELGIIRNHYVGRTFIEPEQKIRQLGVKLKHSANRSVIAGKRVVLIDDSVVRGTTSVKIVQMIYEAGAKEVHMRISSPAIIYPDFYGIDTPQQKDLLAAQYSDNGKMQLDLEGMCEFMGAASLAFLSVNGIYRAMGLEKRDAACPQFTDHCFTGDYPTKLSDHDRRSVGKELSLLAEAG